MSEVKKQGGKPKKVAGSSSETSVDLSNVSTSERKIWDKLKAQQDKRLAKAEDKSISKVKNFDLSKRITDFD